MHEIGSSVSGCNEVKRSEVFDLQVNHKSATFEEMAFFFSAKDDSHPIGARGEESGQVDAPDGVSQLMAKKKKNDR